MPSLKSSYLSNNSAKVTILLHSILLLFFILLYFPVIQGLVKVWSTSDEYSHGFFIVPICLYILWKKKDILSAVEIKSSTWGLVILVVSILVYIFASYAEVVTLASLSMIPALAGIAIYLFGFKFLREIFFPLTLLLFMIPVPAQIYSAMTIPLQLFVTKVSVALSSFIGIPIYREGNVIFLPEETLQVVQACSGLRSIISLLTLSAVVGYFSLHSVYLRTVLFFSAIPVAVVINIIRVLIIIMAFYFIDYDLTSGNMHTMFGLLIFAIGLLLLALIRGVLAFWDRSVIKK